LAPRLSIDGLTVVRGSRTILRGVTLAAAAGEVIGVLGPSGAGKSTLFGAIAGEVDGTGTIRLDDQPLAGPLWARARAGVAYIPQQASVLWELTVRANLACFARIALGSTTEAAVRAAAERVGLEERLDVRAGELSAGERRRLDFARATTAIPRVLLCDEPFAGVDPAGAARLGDFLAALAAREQVAVLLADHHVAEALRVCTRAILLLDGEIAAEGDPVRFQEHPLVHGRYLGSWARSLPPERPPR
jgi:lipopolysaccharide export system ATP-binding protein